VPTAHEPETRETQVTRENLGRSRQPPHSAGVATILRSWICALSESGGLPGLTARCMPQSSQQIAACYGAFLAPLHRTRAPSAGTLRQI
jgi:hypothetical protein